MQYDDRRLTRSIADAVVPYDEVSIDGSDWSLTWALLRCIQDDFYRWGYYTRAIRPGIGDFRCHPRYACTDLRCTLWLDDETVDLHGIDYSFSDLSVCGNVDHIQKGAIGVLGLYLTAECVVISACEVSRTAGAEVTVRFLAQDPVQVAAFVSCRASQSPIACSHNFKN